MWEVRRKMRWLFRSLDFDVRLSLTRKCVCKRYIYWKISRIKKVEGFLSWGIKETK